MAVTPGWLPRWAFGLALAAVAAASAFGLSAALPAVPWLTACVALGMVVAQIPSLRPALSGVLKPGLTLSSRRLLRIGIVLLGLRLSLVDIVALGWLAIVMICLIVTLTFGLTVGLGRLVGLPGNQPLLIAAGFSICGASAVGAMSAVTRSKDSENATPIALVTLCGTLAIFILPIVRVPLGLDDRGFGAWAGLSVHDVGQVVATAQIAGPTALAAAVIFKLTRVLALAPMVALVGSVQRRRDAARPIDAEAPPAASPPLVPLFILGFLAAVLVRTFVPLPEEVFMAANELQTMLLAVALFALGTGIRFSELARTGGRALVVGLASWGFIAAASLGAVALLGL